MFEARGTFVVGRTMFLIFSYNKSAHLALILLGIVFLVSTGNAAKLESSGRADMISEIPVSSDVIPQWCYQTEPSFVFVEGQSLYRANLSAQKTLLQALDAPIDSLTLRCSLDGKTIFFLTAQHEFAYIIQDGTVSKYELRKDFAEINVRYGSLMSPDGSTFILGVARRVSGPDVLKNKKVIDLNSGDVFWSSKYLVHPLENSAASRSREYVFDELDGDADQSKKKRITLPSNALVDNIEECSSGRYVVTFWGESNDLFARSFVLDRPQERIPILPGRLIGELNHSQSGCLLPIMSEDRGFDAAVGLLLITSGSMRTFKLPAARYFGSRFYLSRDLKYAITYETPLPRNEIRGRIVVLQFVPLVK